MVIVSSCDNGDQKAITRVYTIYVSKQEDGSVKMEVEPEYKSLGNYRYQEKGAKVCALGNEYLVQNKKFKTTTLASTISSTDLTNYYSYEKMDTFGYLFTDETELVCIRDSPHALILSGGKSITKKYMALLGNKRANLYNRVHSVIDIDGFSVEGVAAAPYGYIVTLSDGKTKKFQTVITDGPWIYYTGSNSINAFVLDVNNFQGKAKFQISYSVFEFKPAVTVKQTIKESFPSGGIKSLESLVIIDGPVFDININTNGSTANISLLPAA